jgi:hypothetical protein
MPTTSTTTSRLTHRPLVTEAPSPGALMTSRACSRALVRRVVRAVRSGAGNREQTRADLRDVCWGRNA